MLGVLLNALSKVFRHPLLFWTFTVLHIELKLSYAMLCSVGDNPLKYQMLTHTVHTLLRKRTLRMKRTVVVGQHTFGVHSHSNDLVGLCLTSVVRKSIYCRSQRINMPKLGTDLCAIYTAILSPIGQNCIQYFREVVGGRTIFFICIALCPIPYISGIVCVSSLNFHPKYGCVRSLDVTCSCCTLTPVQTTSYQWVLLLNCLIEHQPSMRDITVTPSSPILFRQSTRHTSLLCRKYIHSTSQIRNPHFEPFTLMCHPPNNHPLWLA